MALDNASGYVAAGTLQDLEDASLPMFEVSRVELQFSIAANFVAARVANDVLILALSTGRIMRIDLNRSADIEDLDLPKKPSETGVIRRMFLDPTASHCIFATTLADNYYLHTQSRQPKLLSRLRGVPIESVSWNPSEPTASTREILVGASDGNMYETFIEPSTEFYRREEKYCKQVYKAEGPITGIWTDTIPAKPDTRRVVIATPLKLSHFVGKAGRSGDGPVFLRFFEAEEPAVYEIGEGSRSKGALAISPDISRASPLILPAPKERTPGYPLRACSTANCLHPRRRAHLAANSSRSRKCSRGLRFLKHRTPREDGGLEKSRYPQC